MGFDKIQGKLVNHKHKVGEIEGLDDRLADAVNLIRSSTIDFQQERETVQMRNLNGDISYVKIVADNVARLNVSIDGAVQSISLVNGEWNGSIAVPDGILVVWNINRITEGAIASVSFKFK